MIPYLFSPSLDQDFSTNGIGRLYEATECTCSNEINGQYELKLSYPRSGKYFKDIQRNSIIKAKVSDTGNDQLFEVYKITKSIKNTVSISAKHISYDLSDNLLFPFKAYNTSEAMSAINNTNNLEGDTYNKFRISCNFSNDGLMKIESPVTLRSAIIGDSNSFVSIYGGELYADNFNLAIKDNIGSDKGVTLRYGRNITDLSQDISIENAVTAFLPYWLGTKTLEDDRGHPKTIPWIIKGSKYYSPNHDKFPREKVQAIDVTSYIVINSRDKQYQSQTEEEKKEEAWTNKNKVVINSDQKDTSNVFPSEADVNKALEFYIKDKERINELKFGVPEISTTISFVKLRDTEEYKDVAALETVDLGDIITVIFPELDISAKAEVKSIDYNVLKERYNSITLGEFKKTFTSILRNEQAQNWEGDWNQYTELIKLDGTYYSRFEKTAEAIEMEVGLRKKDGELIRSTFNMRCDAIEMTVSNDEKQTDARFTMTDNKIETEVNNRISGDNTVLKQTSDMISTEANARKTADNGLTADYTSKITQTASSIMSAVSTKVDNTTYESYVKQTSDAIQTKVGINDSNGNHNIYTIMDQKADHIAFIGAKKYGWAFSNQYFYAVKAGTETPVSDTGIVIKSTGGVAFACGMINYQTGDDTSDSGASIQLFHNGTIRCHTIYPWHINFPQEATQIDQTIRGNNIYVQCQKMSGIGDLRCDNIYALVGEGEHKKDIGLLAQKAYNLAKNITIPSSYDISVKDTDGGSKDTGVSEGKHYYHIVYSITGGSTSLFNYASHDAYFTSASDRRVKKNIEYLNQNNNLIGFYIDLKPISFDYKERDMYQNNFRGHHYGLIAQDVLENENNHGLSNENYLVEICQASDNEKKYTGDYLYYVNYEELHALHIMMIQKQEKQISKLENKVSNLEGEIAILKQQLQEVLKHVNN